MPASASPPELPSAAARLRALTAPSTPGWTPSQATADPPPVTVTVAESADTWRDRLHAVTWWRSLGWLLLVGVAVIAAGAFGLFRHHGNSDGEVASAPAAAAPPVTVASPVAQIVVDVGGHVRHPGLVTLPAGARVADAIAAAGGAVNSDEVATLDLAAHVTDGELLLVGVAGAATSGGSGGTSGPLSLNVATVEQLDALPGVGPVLAQRIVTWRDAHGGFRTVDQLQQVPGIGARKYADLKALVSV